MPVVNTLYATVGILLFIFGFLSGINGRSSDKGISWAVFIAVGMLLLKISGC